MSIVRLRRVGAAGEGQEGVHPVRAGAGASERRRRLYGFSWTSKLDLAREFADDHRRREPDGGVVLETLAPAEAILLIRKEKGYYDEAEVVVDPFRLGKVAVVERLPSQTDPLVAST